MKVLLVITKATWGGATKYVYDMARSLHENGTKVAVAYGSEGILTDKLDDLSIPHYHINGLTRDIGFFRELKAYKGILSIIDDFEPDIVHVNSSKGGISALAARLRGKKVVFTSHGWAFNERRNPLSKFIFKVAYFFTMAFADKTILVSEALRRPIRSWPFTNKLRVISNGIEMKELCAKNEARTALAEIDPTLTPHINQTWLMTIAELHDSKGIDTMLSALVTLREENPMLQYLVLGEGDERWRLEKLIESYGLEDNVHLLGFVEQASLYIKAADIFVLPSRTEALGYVLLEAGAAEVPVVASRVGGIPEIIEHNRNGLLIPPGGGVVFAIAISSLLSDRHKQKELAKTLYEDVHSKYSLENMVAKTSEIYTTLLHE